MGHLPKPPSTLTGLYFQWRDRRERRRIQQIASAVVDEQERRKLEIELRRQRMERP
jgi:hypothetical protein